MQGDKTPFPVVRGDFVETCGQVSPDGKWIAYQSDGSRRAEIYVRCVRDASAPVRVSDEESVAPITVIQNWRPPNP